MDQTKLVTLFVLASYLQIHTRKHKHTHIARSDIISALLLFEKLCCR